MSERDDVAARLPDAAANGVLDRRLFLKAGAAGLGALGFSQVRADTRKPWMTGPGTALSGYGKPAPSQAAVQRSGFSQQPGTVGSGASRTPLHHLRGSITPAGLHFERHHSGVPAIDPEQHELSLYGLVERPLKFSMAALDRYPMISRHYFLECSGNSAVNLSPQPADRSCGDIHGLVSGSEWTGIPLNILLEEVGVKPEAHWVVAEGADAARMSRSVPVEKLMEDGMLALYQNGERIRPEQGYPVRLFLPGYEGNISIKWLHRMKFVREPAMTRQETSKYTDAYADGRSEVFTFEMSVKSVITSPSPGLQLDGKGYYEISGLAWSGRGSITRVEVSADGGRTWADCFMEPPVMDKALTRFRVPWRWGGGPAVLMSRAHDQHGAQPSREVLLAERGQRFFYHYNAIQPWSVSSDGRLKNVYV